MTFTAHEEEEPFWAKRLKAVGDSTLRYIYRRRELMKPPDPEEHASYYATLSAEMIFRGMEDDL